MCNIPIITSLREEDRLIESSTKPVVKLLYNRSNNKYSYTRYGRCLCGGLGRAAEAVKRAVHPGWALHSRPEGFHGIPTLITWGWVLKPPLLRVMHRDRREPRVEETFGICYVAWLGCRC